MEELRLWARGQDGLVSLGRVWLHASNRRAAASLLWPPVRAMPSYGAGRWSLLDNRRTRPDTVGWRRFQHVVNQQPPG